MAYLCFDMDRVDTRGASRSKGMVHNSSMICCQLRASLRIVDLTIVPSATGMTTVAPAAAATLPQSTYL